MSEKQKKVGIITFHRSYNSGSILQAYALQKVLKEKYKIDNEIIDFSNVGQKRYYAVLVWPRKWKDILRNGLFGLFFLPINRHRSDYEKYINRIFKLSSKSFSNAGELIGIEDEYTELICGSDQVWNTKCSDADDAYFLCFANHTKKIAYATSMGAHNIIGMGQEVENHYRELLQSFYSISVREYNAQKWISQLVNQKVEITADPTLLLGKDEWYKMCVTRVYKGEYIFYYSFGYDADISEIVRKLSKKMGLPVLVMDAKFWVKQKLFLKGFKLVKHAGPDVFMTLIRDAKIVLTTSLHGTIFSTIFEKKFWYINGSLHSDTHEDDRATSLLKQLGLTDRFITGDVLLNSDPYTQIDYAKSKAKIQPLIDYSFEFLEEVLLANDNEELANVNSESR